MKPYEENKMNDERLTPEWANPLLLDANVRRFEWAFQVYYGEFRGDPSFVALELDATQEEFRALCKALRIKMLDEPTDDSEPLTVEWANQRVLPNAIVYDIEGAFQVCYYDIHNNYVFVILPKDAIRREFRSLCGGLRIPMLEPTPTSP